MRYYIGLDTSCYTTSVAILNEAGELVADERRILAVKEGKRGLAQSEMVFQHMRALPDLWEAAIKAVDGEIAGIGVSEFPRRMEGSYMPAFLTGTGYARTVASVVGCPRTAISHQEGHIYAGLWSAEPFESDDFLAVHVSGGTTEIVRVKRKDGMICETELLGGSSDLHAGQFVDRIGVLLGLSFPAGKKLEQLAKEGHDDPIILPVSVRGMNVSLSGPASHAERLLHTPQDAAKMAAGVELCIATTLGRLLVNAVRTTGCRDILMVGGVMSNGFIRGFLPQYLKRKRIRAAIHYPDARYSPDNAVGAAYAAWLNRI